MKKKWECMTPDKEMIAKISSRFEISELIAGVLVNRGLTNENEIEVFLNPTRKDFYDPYLLEDMDIAVEKIQEVINNNRRKKYYA